MMAATLEERETILDDFARFARYQVQSGDIDPVYPVLGEISTRVCEDETERLELVLLYVAYYNLASALTAWLDGYRFDRELTDDEARYPTGVERRAHRDVRQFRAHLVDLRQIKSRFGSGREGLEPQVEEPLLRWQAIQQRLETVHGNGRWAGYKTGEILDTVLEWSCAPPDAGHANSTGPRHGLTLLFPSTGALVGNGRETIAELDAVTDDLCQRLDLPVAQVETALCDFKSTMAGAYYVGHDIDLMFEQTNRVAQPVVRNLIMDARSQAFDHRWLGEFSGWDGVRRSLKTLYREHKTIEWWSDDSH
jgi:hypothetical protein